MSSVERTWDFVWGRLFDGRTGMFYNHLAGEDAHGTKYLPPPELIQRQIPNPGGYGTGMEDCMLNAGMMMDAVVARHGATGDRGMKEYASEICRGMILAASVSPKKGFLPRGVSPVDGKSHYMDTSRDQYTNWLYGAYRFYYSALSTEAQRADICRCVLAMAEKFCAEVIPENGYSFLREDGKTGVVGKMWGDLGFHEYLRLPMLYLLAWKLSGDARWKDEYLKYRDEALSRTLDTESFLDNTYAALQCQFSVRTVFDLDGEPRVREMCMEHMRKNAAHYEPRAMEKADLLMTPTGAEWLEIPYLKWEESKFRFAGIYGDVPYFVPEPSDFREHLAYYPLRAVGECVSIAALCPGHKVTKSVRDRLIAVGEFVNYEKHRTCAPVALLEGYWLTAK